jgi:hypothetical protein
MYALSSVWDWGQPPAVLTNVGQSHHARFGSSRIRHALLSEMATQQGDWDKLGHEVCDGGVNIFFAYFEPDLDDDIGSYTITNIQPHLFKAQTSANDADNPTWNEALNSPFAERWWQSMEVEINTLENELQAWELVEREPWMNVLPSTWAFKLKRFPDGLVKKFKARFCVRGDKQKEGECRFL